jgi:hypothetical protein
VRAKSVETLQSKGFLRKAVHVDLSRRESQDHRIQASQMLSQEQASESKGASTPEHRYAITDIISTPEEKEREIQEVRNVDHSRASL